MDKSMNKTLGMVLVAQIAKKGVDEVVPMIDTQYPGDIMAGVPMTKAQTAELAVGGLLLLDAAKTNKVFKKDHEIIGAAVLGTGMVADVLVAVTKRMMTPSTGARIVSRNSAFYARPITSIATGTPMTSVAMY